MADHPQSNVPQIPYQAPWNQQRPRKSKNNIWLILIIVFASLFLIIGLICGGVLFWVYGLASDSQTTIELASRDGISTISVPSNWQKDFVENPEATIIAGNKFSENYVVVITEPKDQSDNMTLDGYANLIVNNMKSSLAYFSPGNMTNTTINGMPAIDIQIGSMVESVQIVYFISFVEGKEHFHQVVTWTLPQRHRKNQPLLDKVRKSFREK
ncbi:MAG: hypothetical protein ABL888_20835 [Pirellulaceae bacterium]